jgi:4-hydroxybenzoate polyprenyltransferase
MKIIKIIKEDNTAEIATMRKMIRMYIAAAVGTVVGCIAGKYALSSLGSFGPLIGAVVCISAAVIPFNRKFKKNEKVPVFTLAEFFIASFIGCSIAYIILWLILGRENIKPPIIIAGSFVMLAVILAREINKKKRQDQRDSSKVK